MVAKLPRFAFCFRINHLIYLTILIYIDRKELIKYGYFVEKSTLFTK